MRVLVTGAGPIGLLAALLGVQRGRDVHVFDRVTDGPKPQLVADLGATYHTGEIVALGAPDIVIECSGAPRLVLDVIAAARPNAIVCLTGVSSGGRTIPVDAVALSRELVLENNVVFGSVTPTDPTTSKVSRLWNAPMQDGSAGSLRGAFPCRAGPRR